MSHRLHDLKRGDCRSPTNPVLLKNPLDFIHEDHLREREICALLDALAAAGAADGDTAACALSFLTRELPLHLADEEEDLFPLLRRRCLAEDQIDRAITRLRNDHRNAETDTPGIVEILEGVAGAGREMTGEDKASLTRYASHARRHLILENAIVLPFARLRLTANDLETLRLRMMQRRGLDQLQGSTSC